MSVNNKGDSSPSFLAEQAEAHVPPFYYICKYG